MPFANSRKDGVSLGVSLVHVVVSSAKLAALKAKGFGKFSVNPASCSLFLRFFAGCSGMNRRKEKPPETCSVPTVLHDTKMVGVVELESTTSTMSTWRSNQLSYTPSFPK